MTYLDLIRKADHELDYGEITIGEYEQMIEPLNREIQPERKTGKWKIWFDNKYLEKYYYCSNCGCCKYTEDEPSDYFCSNCGANMMEKEK